MTNQLTIESPSGADPYNEAQLRLLYARQVADYLAGTELDGHPDRDLASREVIAGVVAAVSTLVSDAECLLEQTYKWVGNDED